MWQLQRLKDIACEFSLFSSNLQYTTEGDIAQFQSTVPNLSILASVFHHTAAFIGHGWCPQAYLVKQRF